MEETYNTKAITLNRGVFNEFNTGVTVYAPDKGKLELVARGTKKTLSKLAGHLEPICLTNIMIVRGKQYDYIGSAVSQNCYFNIKDDFNKLTLAGRAIGIFNQLIKAGEADKDIFELLNNFLDLLNKQEISSEKYDILINYFIFKLLILLGYKPELYSCVACKKKILSGNNSFNLNKGGLICKNCSSKSNENILLTISDDCIKVLRLMSKKKLDEAIKIKVSAKLNKEINYIICSFLQYNA